MTNLSKIIKGCKAGKNDARGALYRMFSSKFYAICLRYSGNEEDAKDILQEGFIKIFDKIKQFSGKGSFEGWMVRIMINTALEKYRTRHFLHNSDQEPVSIAENFSVEVTDDLSVNELLGIIQELSPQYRMVFNLYAIEGYSHKEISQMLHISEGTSKSNLARARGILQQKVKKHYSEAKQII